MSKQSYFNIVLFLGYAMLAYIALFMVETSRSGYTNSSIAVSLSVVVASLGLGVAAQLIFDWHCTRSFRLVLKYALVTIGLMLGVLVLFAWETIICLVLGLPIIGVALIFGLLVTRYVLGRMNGKSMMCLPFLALPLMAPAIDTSALFPMQSYAVTTQLEMRGTPAQLRVLAQNVPLITNDERPWTITHNLLRAPRPLQANLRDGVRYAQWEHGVAFEEVLIDDGDPNTIAWQFRFPDPDLLDPIDYHVSPTGPEVFMDQGQYRFEQINDDRTRVSLTTTYRLNTIMNGYLALWGEVLLDDFHMAVLHVIAQRAEATL